MKRAYVLKNIERTKHCDCYITVGVINAAFKCFFPLVSMELYGAPLLWAMTVWLTLPATLSSDSRFPSSEYRAKSRESKVLMLPARSGQRQRQRSSSEFIIQFTCSNSSNIPTNHRAYKCRKTSEKSSNDSAFASDYMAASERSEW